jgi:hypothetical protein
VERLRAILLTTGMAPARWKLEITEALLHESNSGCARMIAPLDAIGVQFALDDFGTGYSSLASIKRFRCRPSRSTRASSPIWASGDDSASVAAAIMRARTRWQAGGGRRRRNASARGRAGPAAMRPLAGSFLQPAITRGSVHALSCAVRDEAEIRCSRLREKKTDRAVSPFRIA